MSLTSVQLNLTIDLPQSCFDNWILQMRQHCFPQSLMVFSSGTNCSPQQAEDAITIRCNCLKVGGLLETPTTSYNWRQFAEDSPQPATQILRSCFYPFTLLANH